MNLGINFLYLITCTIIVVGQTLKNTLSVIINSFKSYCYDYNSNNDGYDYNTEKRRKREV